MGVHYTHCTAREHVETVTDTRLKYQYETYGVYTGTYDVVSCLPQSVHLSAITLNVTLNVARLHNAGTSVQVQKNAYLRFCGGGADELHDRGDLLHHGDRALQPVARAPRKRHEVVPAEGGYVDRDGVLGIAHVAVVVRRYQLRARERRIDGTVFCVVLVVG